MAPFCGDAGNYVDFTQLHVTYSSISTTNTPLWCMFSSLITPNTRSAHSSGVFVCILHLIWFVTTHAGAWYRLSHQYQKSTPVETFNLQATSNRVEAINKLKCIKHQVADQLEVIQNLRSSIVLYGNLGSGSVLLGRNSS